MRFGQAAAAPTFTVTLSVWPPAGPVQERLKVVVVVAIQEKAPEVPLPPGPPVTVQLVMLPEVQLIPTESSLLTVIGPLSPLALISVGVAAPPTVTVTETGVELPPGPVQFRV